LGKIPLLLLLVLVAVNGFAQDIKHEIVMSPRDKFVLVETSDWKIKIQRYRPFRFADINIAPNQGRDFDLQLYFNYDSSDKGKFSSSEKIKNSVKASSEPYLSTTIEKTIELKELTVKEWYGWYTVLTDAKLANLLTIPEGEFKYITRGMVRLSQDSVLGFSLMTNTLETEEYKKAFDYILSFVKGVPQVFTHGPTFEAYL
jgi:hypothetical protein